MSARRITPRDFLDLLPIVAGEGWHVIQSYVGISYIRNARG